MSCAAAGCTNAKRFKLENISFHRFPKGHLLFAWKHALGLRENWTWSSNKYVCSKHFMDSDYILIGTRSLLKLNAVPYVHASNVEQPHGSSTVFDSSTYDSSGTRVRQSRKLYRPTDDPLYIEDSTQSQGLYQPTDDPLYIEDSTQSQELYRPTDDPLYIEDRKTDVTQSQGLYSTTDDPLYIEPRIAR